MFRKINEVIFAQVSQGLSLIACRRAIAMAITIGVFPIMGFSTLMNVLAGYFFKLNQPILQSLNWVVGPLKLVLILPFIRIGERLFQAEPFSLSLIEFTDRFFTDMAATTVEFIWTFVHAIVAWCLCAPLLYTLLFILMKPIIARISRLATLPSSGI